MTREEAIEKVREMKLSPGKDAELIIALHTLIPELKESEDERLRKLLVWQVHRNIEDETNDLKGSVYDGIKGHDPDLEESIEDWKKCLAYLEKQKEQKPASTEDMPYITDEHFFEREPADSFKYKLAEYMTKCCTKKEGPYGYEYGISAESILKMAEEELLKRGVVQKPVEPSNDELQRHQDELYDFKVFAAKQAREHHISFVHDFEWNNFCGELLSYFNEKQKPAEWSEFDEDCLKRAIWYVENPAPSVVKDTNLALWLKSLPLNLKKKNEDVAKLCSNEWSEEDKKMLDDIIRSLPRMAMGNIEMLPSIAEQYAKRLKSLRPQLKQVWTEEDDRICHLIMANLSESARRAITLPMETVNDFNNWLRTLQCMPPVFTDWNEEDQTLLSDALGCVTMVQELKKRGKLKNFHISCSYDELRSWVRSLKSRPRKQPHWKPTEEQMEALDEYIWAKYPNTEKYSKAVLSLRDELKKLT